MDKNFAKEYKQKLEIYDMIESACDDFDKLGEVLTKCCSAYDPYLIIDTLGTLVCSFAKAAERMQHIIDGEEDPITEEEIKNQQIRYDEIRAKIEDEIEDTLSATSQKYYA